MHECLLGLQRFEIEALLFDGREGVCLKSVMCTSVPNLPVPELSTLDEKKVSFSIHKMLGKWKCIVLAL